MLEVKTVKDVFQIIRSSFADYKHETEKIPITHAAGRITSADIKSPENVPGFNRSTVDGYAVISSDTFGASETLPAQLELAGEVKMGEKPGFAISAGQAAYVPTGGELPQGADAVIMIEYSENFNDGFIYLNKSAAPGNNVIFAGDDARCGASVIASGTRLRPQDIGALAALGCCEVEVKRRLKVGIISTGDEVVDIREQLVGSKVRDVNSYTLYTGLVDYGVQPILYGIVGDSYDKIRQAVDKAAGECDVVLISGGSSVGTKDETFNVINSLGEPGVLVHGIAVKPGKPTIIGKVGEKAVIGLPGHPVSAYIIFKVFVCSLLDVMNGFSAGVRDSKVRARMACNYPSNNGREEFLPVRLETEDGETRAEPVFGKSGLITLLTRADGYVHIDRSCEGLGAGQEVEVIIF